MEQSNGFMDKLAQLIKDFSMSKFMPKLDTVLGWIELITRLAVMAAPAVVLILGLIYFFIPPKEANHSLGYRFYWGMGSVEAWRFTQKIAGLSWSVVGLVMSLVMLLITNGYRGMELLAMTENAAKCLLWEIGIMVVLCLAIDVVVLLRYDRKGNVRPKTVIRVPDHFLEFRRKPNKKTGTTEAAQVLTEQTIAEPVPEEIPALQEQPTVYEAAPMPVAQEAFAAPATDEMPLAPEFFAAAAPVEQPPVQVVPAYPETPVPMPEPLNAAIDQAYAVELPPEAQLPTQTE